MGRKPVSSSVSFFARSLPFLTPIPRHHRPQVRALHPLPLPSSYSPATIRPFSTSTVPSSASSDEGPSSISASETEIRSEIHMDFVAKAYSGIGKSVISKCSYLWEEKAETFTEKSSLRDVLKMGLNLSPETIRSFWRVPELKPEGFLEILLGFGSDVNLRTVDFLWNLFKWAERQSSEFRHLQKSYEIMVSMLIKAPMLEEAESLLLSVEVSRVFSDASMMFSEIIQGYAEACRLENSMALYDLARDKGLIPSGSCYQALLRFFIRKGKVEAVLRVYMDMLEFGLGSYSEEHALHFVILELTKKGKIVDALSIIRRVKNSGVEASRGALSAIAEGFCQKKDFNDMLNFLEEWRHIPEVSVCNKIAASLCANLGTQESWLFVQKMEILGFIPDSITFGTFICQSCREGRLRDAFIYLSECFSRSVEPKAYAYNALISGVFKEGLYRHAKYVFDDMVERGLIPDLSTFRILLAGYCKHRKFDEIEQVLSDMNNYSVNSLAPVECALSKALTFLGLDYLGVKVKRDNDVGLPKAEFFDSVGNGLYLETDSEKYETLLDEIIDTGMVPDFDSAIITECKHGNIESALKLKDEVIQWGKKIALATYSELLKRLCVIPSRVKEAMSLVEQFPEFLNQLDSETLNLLVRTLSKNGMVASARLILEQMLRKELLVERDTYTCLLMNLCEERNTVGFWECWEQAKRSNWSPTRKKIIVIISCLCKQGMIKDALELIDGIVNHFPELVIGGYSGLIKELCMMGYTSVGCAMMEAVLEMGLNLDNVNFVNLIKGFLKEQKGNINKALELYNMIERNNWNHGIVIENTIALSLLSIGRHCEAELLLDRINGREVAPAQYNNLKPSKESCDALICGLCDSGRVDEARGLLETMLQIGVIPTHTMYNYVIDKYHANNNLNKAAELLDEMQRAGYSPNFETHWSIISNLSSNSNKKKIGESGGSLLSSLLFGAGLKEKNNEDTSTLVNNNLYINLSSYPLEVARICKELVKQWAENC
ncbi:Pentatricopeptide repeat-containing protein [Ananas comosus]|uniref:Pentatricopeptide repeat-containing protein n=1 Tax=Ananas comosus TaxID=4615 RepID=A0A199VUF4_ANACO|nr:Pentatricopeptide repeat-containing protein [Ananas comosus]